MSVIAEVKMGWLLCHKLLINKIYHGKNTTSFTLRDIFFEINTPFLMDSSSIKLSKESEQNNLTFRKKKKRKSKTNKASFKEEYHTLIKQETEENIKELLKLGQEKCFLSSELPSSLEWLENNCGSRAAGKICILQNDLTEVGNISKGSREWVSTDDPDGVNLLDCILEYTGKTPKKLCCNGQIYVIPPECTFILGDVQDISTLIKAGKKFDVILLDPPWENKSVKRKKGYTTIADDFLLSLPLGQLVNPGCLVLVWATNNERQIHFIKHNLFSYWEINHLADWHWIKITKKGEFVYPFDSLHKKPYENLIIGRKCSDLVTVPAIENHKIIVSIPSSIHSHKPPLTEILRSYISSDGKCLELFARYLLPGWTSIGHEVLKLQHLNLFESSS